LDLESGKILWTVRSTEGFTSLCTHGDKLVYVEDGKLVCLDGRTGRELWRLGFWCDLESVDVGPVDFDALNRRR
ncbi:MAG: outer membrane protein assembly factor BamB family protein, partial [Planctomycetota bacterium]